SNVLLQRRYSHPVDKATGVRSDHTVILTAIGSAKVYPDALRRISYLDVETRKRFKFLTNNFTLLALTISQVYKARWQVELFFESSTWCTPLDVMEFQGSIALNRPLVGSLDGSVPHRSTSALRRIQGALTQACVAGNCFNRINRKTVVSVTPSAAAPSLTDISSRACRPPSR